MGILLEWHIPYYGNGFNSGSYQPIIHQPVGRDEFKGSDPSSQPDSSILRSRPVTSERFHPCHQCQCGGLSSALWSHLALEHLVVEGSAGGFVKFAFKSQSGYFLETPEEFTVSSHLHTPVSLSEKWK
ncbi:unnamed protein product [Rangifer tarandus platyrhynchus]|uniref:Uncharacterized protein n=2 Tax=Rangifer tarandus platyrhynchus TaxID=3082113 RepID=A0ABN8ZGG7_RANTA|nr:unnamed protein product [Rangifer tarandus platyrhynchus]